MTEEPKQEDVLECPTCTGRALDHGLTVECDCGYHFDCMTNKVISAGVNLDGRLGNYSRPARYTPVANN